MRIVVTGYGSTGDTLPLVALAASLQRAGHSVVLVTDEAVGQIAGRLGLDLRVLPGSARSMLTDGSPGWSRTMKSGRPSMQLFAEVTRLNTRGWIETLDAAAEGADVIVATTLVVYHSASVAQEKGIRLVFGQLQPSLETRDYPPPLSGVVGTPEWLNRPLADLVSATGDLFYRSAINKARRDLGQPRLQLAWESLPILAAWSPTLLPAASDWTHPNVTITGPWQLPSDPDWQPPNDLAEFLADGEPPIYVGFGSMAGLGDLPTWRDAIIQGLAGRRALLSSGWAALADTDLPDTVHPIGWAPHDWIFPRCAAIMHHCGVGTTHQAAQSGTPSIPVPFGMDQPFWADRLYKLGIATRPINPRKITSEVVRAAAAEVTRPEVTRKALEIAQRIASEPDGVTAATSAILRTCGL